MPSVHPDAVLTLFVLTNEYTAAPLGTVTCIQYSVLASSRIVGEGTRVRIWLVGVEEGGVTLPTVIGLIPPGTDEPVLNVIWMGSRICFPMAMPNINCVRNMSCDPVVKEKATSRLANGCKPKKPVAVGPLSDCEDDWFPSERLSMTTAARDAAERLKKQEMSADRAIGFIICRVKRGIICVCGEDKEAERG